MSTVAHQQGRLPFGGAQKRSAAGRATKEISRARRAFAAQNVEAAAVILADPERYAGLLLEWAQAVTRE